jgi:hypothetical protein
VKKIGIITFHRSYNYGAVLQTYALQNFILSLGYDSEVIDYKNSMLRRYHRSVFRNMLSYFWNRIGKRSLVGNSRQIKTDNFIASHVWVAKTKYTDSSVLHRNPPQYDAYVTGSDQVWNPNITGGDSSYFLTFVPKNKLKISYAASFGVTILNDEYKKKYLDYLQGIDIISVREYEGKAIVNDLIRKDVQVTVDPTLLLEKQDWEKIAILYNNKKPYVLCYHMPGDKIVNRAIILLARKIARINNWEIISIGQKEYMRLLPGNKKIFNAGPDEFVGLIRNAAFVITNSFHGTVFSIIYNKPFYIPINYNLPVEQVLSSRITSLLKMLNIENRLVPADLRFDELNIEEIEYGKVNVLLRKAREESRRFLIDALREC